MGPMTLEVLAVERVRERLAQARAAQLADQLPRSARRSAVVATRHGLARGLRAVAALLDPSRAGASHSRFAGV